MSWQATDAIHTGEFGGGNCQLPVASCQEFRSGVMAQESGVRNHETLPDGGNGCLFLGSWGPGSGSSLGAAGGTGHLPLAGPAGDSQCLAGDRREWPGASQR